MRRRLFTLLSALSLVLCIGVGLAYAFHHFWIIGPPLWLSVGSSVEVGTGDFDKDPDWIVPHAVRLHRFENGGWFATWREPGERRIRWDLNAPAFLVFATCAILPALWFCDWGVRRLVSLKRSADRQCVLCNYDLRATPDRCPECGTVPIPSKR